MNQWEFKTYSPRPWVGLESLKATERGQGMKKSDQGERGKLEENRKGVKKQMGMGVLKKEKLPTTKV